jgi:hypothetical protein
MYQPNREQAEADRAAAYEAGVPHGEGWPHADTTAYCWHSVYAAYGAQAGSLLVSHVHQTQASLSCWMDVALLLDSALE